MHKSLVLLLLMPMLLIAQKDYPVPQPSETPAQTAAQQEEKELSAEMREQLKRSIKHVLISQVEAWNHGNLENFMAGYWNSPDLTFFSGARVTKGWKPTLARYQQRYQSGGNQMGHLEFQELDIDLLSRRSAVVTGRWKLTMSDGKTPHGLFTLIFMRFPEGWKIVHDHTSAE
ncbi:MAG TPA: nuclear transport factor 2 family protein [Candidatus Acidoferrales bacterium]|nr:nuclear transport factor 2 family protein [Candidatus Acidoferrales bacterium]